MSGRIISFSDIVPNDVRNAQRLIPSDLSDKYPILSSMQATGTPEEARKETFWHLMKQIYFPKLKFKSFTLFISLVNIVMYFITVFYDFDRDKFLTPKESTLVFFGAKTPSNKSNNYEIWRWVTPSLLHRSLDSLFASIMGLILVGFRLEATIGMVRQIIVYELSGLGGVLFCTLLKDAVAVGDLSSVIGIIASSIVWIIMNWKKIPENLRKTISLVNIIGSLLYTLYVSLTYNYLNSAGGVITGAALGVSLFKYVSGPDTKKERWIRLIATGLLAVYFVLGIVLFYTVN